MGFLLTMDKPMRLNDITWAKKNVSGRDVFNFSVNIATGRNRSMRFNSRLCSWERVDIVPEYSGSNNEVSFPDYFRVDISYTGTKAFTKKEIALKFSIVINLWQGGCLFGIFLAKRMVIPNNYGRIDWQSLGSNLAIDYIQLYNWRVVMYE